MFSLVRSFLLISSLFIISTTALQAKSGLPGYENIYVNDYAQLLDENAEERIRHNLKQLYQKKQIQMTVLTVSSVSDYIQGVSIESFATRVFNAWGVGNAERNDGVLILIAHKDRKMRIEIGSGYSRHWDNVMGTVIENSFIPRFKQNAYQAGIEQGVRETISRLSSDYSSSSEEVFSSQSKSFISDLPWFVYTVLIAPLIFFVNRIRRYIRHLPKNCPICSDKMALLGEQADDEHLNGGQQLEEYLSSVDYDVWFCDTCSHLQISAHKAWFSKIAVCPSCRYETLETDTVILKEATTSRSGEKRLDYHCDNCGYSDTELRTIPQVSEHSFDSDSSSFGGGSSSGGGASGSW